MASAMSSRSGVAPDRVIGREIADERLRPRRNDLDAARQAFKNAEAEAFFHRRENERTGETIEARHVCVRDHAGEPDGFAKAPASARRREKAR